MSDVSAERAGWNRCRWVAGEGRGHYESYFQRANHPSRPLAFWIRYTIFSPKGRPEDAVGELWAIYFDGEAGHITAVKQAVPMSQCQFSPTGLDVRIGSARLDDASLTGVATSGSHILQWTLRYAGSDPPLLLLPRSLYGGGFPKAKALVGMPQARYDGALVVDGQEVAIERWIGSQNHNWGSRHTDRYAWGQVAGFDNEPRAFLECSTARVRLGPLWTPWFTTIVLRLGEEEFTLNSLRQSVKANGRFTYFNWELDSCTPRVRVRCHIHAPVAAFVGLRYDNPPGGFKTCLKTQLASCELDLQPQGLPARTLVTKHRAAFEILTDDADHGVAIAA